MTRFNAKKLLLSTALLGAGMANVTSAQAETYYNCATNFGCKVIDTVESSSDYTKTEYPLVMATGLFGSPRLLGVLDYFYKIPQDIIADGGDVFVPQTSAVNSSEVRGEQLLSQIKTITALSDTTKVNIFGHSQGGLDARYVASVSPQLVASVTSISSPQQGSMVADYVKNEALEGNTKNVAVDELNGFAKFLNGLGDFVGFFSDVLGGISPKDLNNQDAMAAVDALASDTVAEFNVKYPEAMPTEYCGETTETSVNGVQYYSFTGNTGYTNFLDPSDALLSATNPLFEGQENDGLVARCSTHLGYVIRDDYKMTHADTINQFFGLVSFSETSPISVYRAQINRLKNVDGL